MKGFFKSFLYFSREEKRGIIVLLAAIVLVVLCGRLYVCHRQQRPPSAEELKLQEESTREMHDFLAQLEEQKENERKEWENRFSRNRTAEEPPVELVPFNPNQADSLTLRRVGLPAWMTRNVLLYRKRGGKFRKAEDFRKVYGLSEEQYRTLIPYIYIAREDTLRTPPPSLLLAHEQGDSLPPRIEKFSPGTVVELNAADTTLLKRIPGIGSGIARSIIAYRKRLGGFYDISQLREINLDHEQLRPWLSVCADSIRCLNVNKAGIERLSRHPYINFYQAKAFVEYRKEHGKLKNLKPFVLLEEFTEKDLERIGHYICFE